MLPAVSALEAGRANANREHTSSSVYMYKRSVCGPSTMVSISTNVPGFSGKGRGGYLCGERWYGCCTKPVRLSARSTLESERSYPSFVIWWCTTLAHRSRSFRYRITAETVSCESASGCDFGRDDFVGIGTHPVPKGCLHHREMVDGSTPYLSATCRIDHPRYLTRFTASLRTFGRWGFFEYAMYIV